MNAAIIAVGSELLTPQRIDTNSLYLTDQLNSLGVEVALKMIVGDDRVRLTEAIHTALASGKVIILTGGLGPTEDDVTRDAVVAAIGGTQSMRPEIVELIEERFRRFGRRMAENNKRQAFIVDGAEVLPNDRGTAPGQWITHNGAVLMLLPGPPNELKGMFEIQCMPRLRAILPPLVIRARFLRVAGMGESDLDQLIAPVYKKYENPATTILAGPPGDIQIHLRARCATEQEAEALLAEVGDPVEALLGDRIYSRNGDPLEAVVGQLLRRRQVTLSVAESATGGMVGERITSIPGSSDYFLGGFLTYSYEAKQKLLGVDAQLLAECKAVSEPVASAMAMGAKQRTGSNMAISITGVAGPDSGGENEPVGVIYIGLADEAGCTVRRIQLPGDRRRIRQWASQAALDMVRRRLL